MPVCLQMTGPSLYVFEIFLYRVNNFLNKKGIMFASLYDFRKESSSEYATLKLLDSVVNALNAKHNALAVLIDFSKAFDTLDHDILLDKTMTL